MWASFHCYRCEPLLLPSLLQHHRLCSYCVVVSQTILSFRELFVRYLVIAMRKVMNTFFYRQSWFPICSSHPSNPGSPLPHWGRGVKSNSGTLCSLVFHTPLLTGTVISNIILIALGPLPCPASSIKRKREKCTWWAWRDNSEVKGSSCYLLLW